MKELSKNVKMTPLCSYLDEEGINKLNIMALNAYKEEPLELPKKDSIVRFIDKDNNIDFEAKISNVKEGKTCLDTVLEIERID